MKRANIINLYKHNIIHRNIKNKQRKDFYFAFSIFAVVLFLSSYLYFVNESVEKSVEVVNPISELYRDVEVASFVNGGVVNIILPIKSSKCEVMDNVINITVTDSIMVYAPASGVVESVDDLNGKKTIKIKHSETLATVVENIDIVGVKVGDVVKQGKEIATASTGMIVKLYVIENNKVVNNLSLNKSYVKWVQN